MKVKPIGNKILLREEKCERKSKIIMLDKKEQAKEELKFIVEEIGDTVAIEIKIGDEVVLCQHAAWINYRGNEEKYGLVPEHDIWAIYPKGSK